MRKRKCKCVWIFGMCSVFLCLGVGMFHGNSQFFTSLTKNKQVTDKNKSTVNIRTHSSTSPIPKTSKADVRKITLKPSIAEALNTSHPVYAAKYVIENSEYCTSVTNLSVLIIVHTAPTHFDIRNAIRSTWANNSYYSNLGTVKVIFLLGLTSDTKVQKKLETEFAEIGDLLQGDFLDSYRNLTLKGVMAYKWITEKCRNAEVVVKVDDDVVVDMIDVLLNKKINKLQRNISCKLSSKGKIFRNKNNKWFVEERFFKGLKTYPRYCFGFIVIFSNYLIPDLYQSALITPFFWIDDVYLYGLVPGNLPNITYSDLKFVKHPNSSNPCTSGGRCPFTVALLHRRDPVVMKQVWETMFHSHVV